MKYANGLYYVTGSGMSMESVVNGDSRFYIGCDFEDFQESKSCVLSILFDTGNAALFVFDNNIYVIDCNTTNHYGKANKTNMIKVMQEFNQMERSWNR